MLTGFGTMTRVLWRTGWKVISAWVIGLIALATSSVASIAQLYDTPEKLRGYADSIAGDTMVVMNGRIAGMGTLGGTFANELAVVASLMVPIMAIALTGRATRKEEEAGRLELLLASRIAHRAPLLAAMTVSALALLAFGLGVSVLIAAYGAPVTGSLLYGLGMAVLGWISVGVTAVVAQLVAHNRSVWGMALTVAGASYLLRGMAAIRESPLVWATPHGLIDETRPFGEEPRWWPLLVGVVAAGLLGAVAMWLNGRRDVDDALLPSRGAPARASSWLRTPIGLAVRQHRGSTVGWAVGAAALMGVYGGLTQEILKAIESNPALGELIGAGAADASDFLERILSVFLMMLGILVAAYVVVVLGSLRAEERTGRLEVQLSGHASRTGWLLVHLTVAALGALLVGLAGALAFGASAAQALAEPDWVPRTLVATAAYAPVVLLFLGLAALLIGVAPRLWAAVWAVFAIAAFIGWMGPGLDMPDWLVDNSPFLAAGRAVFADGVRTEGAAVLGGLAALLLAAGVLGFRRRDVPTL